MELIKDIKGSSKLVAYALGGIGGLIIAGYTSSYLNNNYYELLGGIGLLSVPIFILKGEGIEINALRLAFAVSGLVFIVRGALGFVPAIRNKVDQYTLNIL